MGLGWRQRRLIWFPGLKKRKGGKEMITLNLSNTLFWYGIEQGWGVYLIPAIAFALLIFIYGMMRHGGRKGLDNFDEALSQKEERSK